MVKLKAMTEVPVPLGVVTVSQLALLVTTQRAPVGMVLLTKKLLELAVWPTVVEVALRVMRGEVVSRNEMR